MRTRLPEPSVHFRHLPSGERLDTIWHLLEQGLWKGLDPEVHEYNTQKGVLKQDVWRPVLPGIVPVHAGMTWSAERQVAFMERFKPTAKQVGMREVLSAAEAFFARFGNRRIGVHLSGGLDSSIAIALLRHLGIPFHLVGMTSERYEFRTERHIQIVLAEWGEQVKLLNYEEHLPLSGLEHVPPHQQPDLYNLNYAANKAMAEACERMGIEVLLTGNGGDNVFAEAMPKDPADCPWMPAVFIDGWLDDLAYAPYGVEVVPFYADPGLLHAFWNLRAGQEADNAKLWARRFFRELLPKELSDYTYCADFWGLYVDGLHQAKPMVQDLFQEAHALTAHPSFAPEAYKVIFGQDLLLAQKAMYQRIEARISMAVWLNSLQRDLGSVLVQAGQMERA